MNGLSDFHARCRFPLPPLRLQNLVLADSKASFPLRLNWTNFLDESRGLKGRDQNAAIARGKRIKALGKEIEKLQQRISKVEALLATV